MLLNKEKESRVKFNPGLGANRPSNDWAQFFKEYDRSDVMSMLMVKLS